MEKIKSSFVRNYVAYIALVFAWAAISIYAPPISAEYRSSAKETVAKYCQADFEGANTHTESWKRQIQPLTTWVDGPGWDYLIVVKKFTVNEVKKSKGNIEITVGYEVIGELDGHNFSSKKAIERIVYKLVNTRDGWKINEPQPPPHVSVNATLRLLEQSSIDDEEHRTAIRSSIFQLMQERN